MRAAIKYSAITLGVIILLVIAAVVAITTFIDPNDYKPQIEKIASDQGYPIAIEGDLGWQFFPKIGIAIGATKLLGPGGSSDALISVKQISASVMLLPLLKKQVIIDQVLLDGLQADLQVDAEGNANWQYLIKEGEGEPAPSAEPAPAGGEQQPLSLAANSIRIVDANVHYKDQQSGLDLRLTPLSAEINDLNLDGNAFPIRLEWSAKVNTADAEQTINNNGSLEAVVTLAKDFTSAMLEEGRLVMDMSDSDDKKQTLMEMQFNLAADHLDTEPNIKSEFNLAPTNLKAVLNSLAAEPLQTQKADALTNVGLSLKVNGTANNLSVNPLNINLDGMPITGKLSLIDQNQLQLQLAGGDINVDHYLPPATESTAASPSPTAKPKNSVTQATSTETTVTETTATETTATEADGSEAPLAFLNDYSGSVDIAFNSVTASGIIIKQPKILANIANGTLFIKPISAQLQGKTLTVDGQVNADGNLQAKVVIPAISVRQLTKTLNIPLPEMADNTTLEKVGLSFNVAGTTEDIAINNLNFDLDQTKITGSAKVQNLNTVKVNLAGTELDVDRYLPPPSDVETPAATPTEPASEEPLDLSALKEYGGDVALKFNKLKISGLDMANVNVKATSSDGLAKLQNLSADFYQGKLTAHGQLDAREATPKIGFNGNGKGVAIKPLLAALQTDSTSQKFVLAGLANGTVQMNTEGKTVTALTNNAKANIKANTQSLQLAPINIEKFVCQAVALVQGDSVSALGNLDWPSLTQMQDLNAEIGYANQVATIKSLSAGVEQFKLLAEGKVDIGKESLDVRLPVSFTQPLTKKAGCPATSSWIVGKALSLVRCKGNLMEPTKACGLDDQAIREAAKDYVEAKAKAKVDKKKEEAEQRLDEKKDKLKDKINNELGEGTSDALKNLLNKKKKDN